MATLVWDKSGERMYETGVDHGVLYLPNEKGIYDKGYAWNGLTAVNESPSGAEANPQYADNIKYINLLSTEEFGATIEAFTYPDAFAVCDGTAEIAKGLTIGQQRRSSFGLSYRTLIGDDLVATDRGYKIHLIYGAQAAPSEKSYGTVNDSPEAMTFSWEVTTTPVPVKDFKPTATAVVSSLTTDPDKLKALEAILYGSDDKEPRLPLPDELRTLVGSEVVEPVA